MYGGARAGLGTRAQQQQSSQYAAPAQTTAQPGMNTLFVGSISAGITDALLSTLFSACGPLRSFKRLLNPMGKPQGFGFAEFESPESMVRAIELLNGQELPSLEPGQPAKKLLVRADEKTGNYLSAWQSQRIKTDADDMQTETSKTLIQAFVDGARNGDPLSDTLAAVSDQTTVPAHLHDLQEADLPDQSRGLVISEIALFRERAQKRDRDGNYSKIAGVGPQNAAIAKNPPSAPQATPVPREPRQWGGRQNSLPSGPAASSPATPNTPTGSTPSRAVNDPQSYQTGRPEFVKAGARKTDEERDKESRDSKAKADEQEFRHRERAWEGSEYKRLKKLSHQVALEKATQDAEEKDRHEMKSRLEIWDDDESDELFYTDRARWRERRARQLYSENRADAESRAIDAKEEERQRYEAEQQRQQLLEVQRATQEQQRKAGLLVDDAAPLKFSVNKADAAAGATGADQKKPQLSQPLFAQEEEEDVAVTRKRRAPLVELDFVVDGEKAKEKLENIRTQVTRDKEALWKAKIRWDAITDKFIDSKMDALIKRKMVQYLGDDDDDLVMFVLEHLKDHKAPAKLVEGLEPVLTDEATDFVIDIWRQIVFESVAYGEGLETANLYVD